MVSRHLLLAVIAVGLVGAVPALAARTIYLAPAMGLRQARNLVRPLIAAGLTEDLVVQIRGGVCPLAEPLVFGPGDSGTAQHSVTYAAAEGETVVVTGGRAIGGWKQGEGELWTAHVPGVAEGEWYPELLVVNGKAATRARTPNADANPPYLVVASQRLEVDKMLLHLGFPPRVIGAWRNPKDVQMVCLGNWAINRMRVVSLQPDLNSTTFLLPAKSQDQLAWNWPGPGRYLFFENAREFLDQPGEWYLDRATGTVTYWPREGEDMTRAEVWAPYARGLLQITGTTDQPVRNLHFRGLRFEQSAWPLPAGDYHGVQACHFATGGNAEWAVAPCALRLENAQNCSITDGGVAHCEAGGIELANRCEGCRIQGNEITDIGANGVMVGGPDDEAQAPKRNQVADNWVHACGARFYGAIGIWIGFASETQVTHNQVNDLPYSGISDGWVWAAKASACKANVISDNHIFDCMKKLCDGGGIYTLGLQPGTVIRGNLIHDIYRSPFAQGAPCNGMFIDEGSTGFLFQDNVIYATPEGAVRHNANSPQGHTWRDNHFDLAVLEPGLVGGALSCPGSYLEVPPSEALEPAKLTLTAWVKLDHFPQGGDPRRWVVNKSANEWAEGHYALNTEAGMVGAYLNIGGGQANMLDAWSPEGTLTLGRWHMLAMSYDGATLRVYCDGKQVAQKALNRPRVPGTGPLAIGRRQDAYNSFEGLIDEVRVYNRALPPEEIAAQFAAGTAQPPRLPGAGSTEGLVGYWGFDEQTDAQRILEAIRAKAGPVSPWRERFRPRQ